MAESQSTSEVSFPQCLNFTVNAEVLDWKNIKLDISEILIVIVFVPQAINNAPRGLLNLTRNGQ